MVKLETGHQNGGRETTMEGMEGRDEQAVLVEVRAKTEVPSNMGAHHM